jgi:ferredoxin
MVANISPDVCTGCGICAGACPAGAIVQDGVSTEALSGSGRRVPEGGRPDQSVVFACSRSPLPEEGSGAVLVPVSCVGRVPVESMLECLARGARGVLMLCRDQATCPSGPGGALGEARAIVAEALAASAGLGKGRIQCIKPRTGPGGPEGTVEAFDRSLDPIPLEAFYNNDGKETGACGMDRALRIMAWLRTRPELEPRLPPELEGVLDPSASDGETLFYLGDLTDLDLLLSLVIREWRLKSLIEDGSELLRRKGINALPVMTARGVEESTASRVVVFSRSGLPDFGPAKEIITLDELAGAEPVADCDGAARFTFRISPGERRALLARIQASAEPARCSTPYELAQRMLLQREGAWREAFMERPFMAFSEAVRNLTTGTDA